MSLFDRTERDWKQVDDVKVVEINSINTNTVIMFMLFHFIRKMLMLVFD